MRNNSGFTLIELVLVTVIIGILAGAVAISVRGRVDASAIDVYPARAFVLLEDLGG